MPHSELFLNPQKTICLKTLVTLQLGSLRFFSHTLQFFQKLPLTQIQGWIRDKSSINTLYNTLQL